MKSKEVSVLILSSLILLPFFAGESFAQQNQSISITTEKESYAAGEPVKIVGLVEIRLGEMQAIIQVFSPIGNMIDVAQVDVDNDGQFTKTVKTSLGGSWKETGTYSVKVTYGENSSQAQFEYGGMASAEVKSGTTEFGIAESESSDTFDLEGHDLEYDMEGADIIRMFPDPENNSLIVEIKTFSDGELTITLPKTVIDTNEEGFFVLVDGDETKHDALSVPGYWTLTIPFAYGSQEIEIIGTFVIPEFGTVAVLILMLSITTIVIISAKNKQIFYLRT